MGLWRCQNAKCSTDQHGRLIFDFEADRPVCPKCGASNILGRPARIIKLECIHYDPPSDEFRDGFRRGLNEWACQPGRPWKNGHASGDASAVTCPDCKRTAVCIAALEAMNGSAIVPLEADLPIRLDEKKQAVIPESEARPPGCCE